MRRHILICTVHNGWIVERRCKTPLFIIEFIDASRFCHDSFISFLSTAIIYIYTYQEMFSIQRSTSRWCVLSSFHNTNEAEIVLDIDRDAGCCRVALDENPSVEPAELKGEDKYE